MISVNIDLSDLDGLLKLDKGFNDMAQEAIRDLGEMIHSKAIELASEKLHSRRQMYVEALSTSEEEGVFIVELAASARWIDDGQSSFDIKEGLLSGPNVKTAKDGSRYAVVGFGHGPGKGPGTSSKTDQDLVNAIKSDMKKRGISFGGIEKDTQGQPKLGKLHSFSVGSQPIKTAEGPGQGKGPKGAARQGPSGTPFLDNVSVYQSRSQSGKVKKSIMTFRTVSSNQQDRWQHPGNAAVPILAEATEWALETWSKEVAPALVDRIMVEVSD